jgi:hypothetical protein
MKLLIQAAVAAAAADVDHDYGNSLVNESFSGWLAGAIATTRAPSPSLWTVSSTTDGNILHTRLNFDARAIIRSLWSSFPQLFAAFGIS